MLSAPSQFHTPLKKAIKASVTLRQRTDCPLSFIMNQEVNKVDINDFDYMQDIDVVNDFKDIDKEDIDKNYPYVVVNNKLWKMRDE